MDISDLGKINRPRPREMLEGAPAAVIRVWGDGTGTLMMGGAGAKAGERLRLRPVRGHGLSLDDAQAGLPASGDRRAVAPSAPGDLVIVEAARMADGELLCGPAVARMHDELRGEVQAVYALARPTRLTVSRFGPTQFVKLLDPTRARRASTAAEVEAAAAELLGARWLGAEPGFLVRNAHKPPGRMSPGELGACKEYDVRDGEDAARFARRLVDVEGILSPGEGDYALAGGPVELIPTAVLPMGREQMFREGGNLTEPAEARVGNHAMQYLARGRLGFVPSFALVGDEPEFKFKAPTGAYARRCVGLEPRAGVPAVAHSGVATPVRPIGTAAKPFPVLAPAHLYKPAEAAEAAAARAARRGPDPEPRVAPQAGRPGAQGFQGSRPGPRTLSRAAPAAPAPVAVARVASGPAPKGGLADLAGLGSPERDDGAFGP